MLLLIYIGVNHNEIVFDFTDVIGCGGDSLTFEYLALLEDSFNTESIIFQDYLFDYNVPVYNSFLDSLARGTDPYWVLGQLNLSSQLDGSLTELYNLVEDMLDYSQFLVQFNTLVNAQSTLLTDNDLATFYSAAVIAKHSYLLWAPVAKGGMYWQDRMCTDGIGNRPGANRNGDGCWSRIILTDVTGLVSSATAAVVTTSGWAVLPNPALGGLPTASVAGVILGAGASINTAINSNGEDTNQTTSGPGGGFDSSLIFQETGFDLCNYYPNHPSCD